MIWLAKGFAIEQIEKQLLAEIIGRPFVCRAMHVEIPFQSTRIPFVQTGEGCLLAGSSLNEQCSIGRLQSSLIYIFHDETKTRGGVRELNVIFASNLHKIRSI